MVSMFVNEQDSFLTLQEFEIQNSELLFSEDEWKSIVDDISQLWGVPVFYDEKDEEKYVKKLVSLCRHSYEYKVWTQTLKQSLGINKCVFTHEGDDCTVELHHYPLTLYDLHVVALDYMLERKPREELSSFLVVEHVLKLHYEMKVGVVPLIKTLHEKFHKSYFPIPKEWIIGDWRYIFQCGEYKLRDHLYSVFQITEQMSLDNLKFSQVNWPQITS